MIAKSFMAMLLAATSLAVPHHHAEAEKRQESETATATASIDYAKISGLLHSYAGEMTISPLFPSPSVTLGLSIPDSLRKEIMTAVPASIVVQLVMDSEYRASVASDFKAGNTPSWYDKLDPELKTFFQNMAKSIQTGDAVFTRTPEPTATDDDSEGEVAATSTSDDLAMPTGVDRVIMAGVVGMAGVLGVALAL